MLAKVVLTFRRLSVDNAFISVPVFIAKLLAHMPYGYI